MRTDEAGCYSSDQRNSPVSGEGCTNLSVTLLETNGDAKGVAYLSFSVCYHFCLRSKMLPVFKEE